jgi:hypothetical protein
VRGSTRQVQLVREGSPWERYLAAGCMAQVGLTLQNACLAECNMSPDRAAGTRGRGLHVMDSRGLPIHRFGALLSHSVKDPPSHCLCGFAVVGPSAGLHGPPHGRRGGADAPPGPHAQPVSAGGG